MYFKELAHVIVRPGKSKSCRVDQQDGHPGKSWNLSLKAVSWQFTHLQGRQSFSVQASADWIGFTVTMEGYLLYSVYPFKC